MAHSEIKVTATFSLSKKPAFHRDYASSTTLGTVLTDVRNYFEAKDEPNVNWYLSAHDERQPADKTLADVAGEAEAVAFRLVKEITQG